MTSVKPFGILVDGWGEGVQIAGASSPDFSGIGKAKPLTTKDTREHERRRGEIAEIGEQEFRRSARTAEAAAR
jgi:hypothetical protein